MSHGTTKFLFEHHSIMSSSEMCLRWSVALCHFVQLSQQQLGFFPQDRTQSSPLEHQVVMWFAEIYKNRFGKPLKKRTSNKLISRITKNNCVEAQQTGQLALLFEVLPHPPHPTPHATPPSYPYLSSNTQKYTQTHHLNDTQRIHRNKHTLALFNRDVFHRDGS